MSDHWYYAEGERTIGPVTLIDLKKALQEHPNCKDVFVWRAGYDGWRKAEGRQHRGA